MALKRYYQSSHNPSCKSSRIQWWTVKLGTVRGKLTLESTVRQLEDGPSELTSDKTVSNLQWWWRTVRLTGQRILDGPSGQCSGPLPLPKQSSTQRIPSWASTLDQAPPSSWTNPCVLWRSLAWLRVNSLDAIGIASGRESMCFLFGLWVNV